MGLKLADDTRDGLATAVATLGAGDPPSDGAEQSELFDDVPPAMLKPAETDGARACVGRPRGSRNRRTEEWLRYLQSRYTSPLIGLAETWSRSPEDLARELKLFARDDDGYVLRDRNGRERLAAGAVAEAYKIQVACMKEALPYWHQKQPLAVEHKGDKRGLLVLDLGGFEAPEGDGIDIRESVENQRVIEGELEPSQGVSSHDDE